MIYVSSDWHGCPLQKIKDLLDKADFSDDDFLFVLGDVIDRGEHSAKLLKFLMYAPNIQLIRGNHEQMMLSCRWVFGEITEDSIGDVSPTALKLLGTWQFNGGNSTLASLRRLPPDERADILEFIEETPLYDTVRVGDKKFLLVHGGLDNYSPDKRIDEYTANELLWARPIPDDRYSEKFMTIVGHTPTGYYSSEHRGRIFKTDTWMNIDTGAASGGDPCLVRLDDMEEFYLCLPPPSWP